MSEFISPSFVNVLKQYAQQVPAREPAINRGHRLRDIKGGRINRVSRINKSSKIGAKSVRGAGDLPRQDNPWSAPVNPVDNIGRAIGEHAANLRYNLVATNNVSVIRDFFGAGPDINADVLASSGPPNPSYAVGAIPKKPTIYDIYVDATGARAPGPTTHPNLILYATAPSPYGLRNFNPAYPVKILGAARNSAARVAAPPPIPPLPGCPAVGIEIPIVQELVIFPSGWDPLITDDIGFYYMVVHHDYIAGAATDMTCFTDVDFLILGYEGN